QKSECGIFIGSSATRADIKANSKFEVGYGMLPYWPDVAGAPQNTIIGGATLWVLRDRPRAEYHGVAKFFAFLSKPEVQAAWHQNTGYLPVTQAAYELTRTQGFYDRNPGAAISIEQITMKPPTVNSRGVRLGSFVLVRDAIEDELELVFAGKKSAQAALDAAGERGNRLLRPVERAHPGRLGFLSPSASASSDENALLDALAGLLHHAEHRGARMPDCGRIGDGAEFDQPRAVLVGGGRSAATCTASRVLPTAVSVTSLASPSKPR